MSSRQLTFDEARHVVYEQDGESPVAHRVEYLSLDDWTPGRRPPRARRSDPDSSHRAADQAEASGLIGHQAAEVLAAVRELPGLSSKQLAEGFGLCRYAAARRLPELERRGLVYRVRRGSEDVRWFPRTRGAGDGE